MLKSAFQSQASLTAEKSHSFQARECWGMVPLNRTAYSISSSTCSKKSRLTFRPSALAVRTCPELSPGTFLRKWQVFLEP
jgi:hypothetical protein